ncbi:MAG: transcription termination/antitermination NusG family protein [Pirellulaceae bacterium]
MPILPREPDIYPDDLLQNASFLEDVNRDWWCMYTRSRREKELMRRMKAMSIAFYSPVISKRSRSPQGRIRESFVPLFPNYVFVYGTDAERYQAMTTNNVSKYSVVNEREQLVEDLQRIQIAINVGEPLTPESRLEAGNRVRVRSGPFRGYEGLVIRREGKTRLLLTVRYLEQGVSMAIDEGLLEAL